MFINSRNFSNICDVVVCPNLNMAKNLELENPKRIFITGEWCCFEQLLKYLKSFKNKYELVYHCSDSSFDRFKFESIRKNVTHIYAENCEIEHPMITQLPLGFHQDYKEPDRQGIPFHNRTILCYLNVGLYNDELKFVKSKIIRQECLDFFRQKDFVKIESNVSREHFFNSVNNSKFVVCPPGYGLDTFRFYESSYLGSVPIVLSSGLDSLYKKYNAIIVDSWEEITEEFLLKYSYVPPDEELFKVENFIK